MIFALGEKRQDWIGLCEVCMASWQSERELLVELHCPHEMTANYYQLARPLHEDGKNNVVGNVYTKRIHLLFCSIT